MDDFRRFFFRGLAALLPTLLTIAVIIWAYRLVETHFGVHVTRAMMSMCSAFSEKPPEGWLRGKEDAIRYGEPIAAWDEQGCRLTVEYKVLERFEEAVENLRQAEDPERRAEIKDEVLPAVTEARNDALWQILFAKYRLNVLGFAIAIIFVYFLGYFLASLVGRRAWRTGEGLIGRVPLIRQVYANIKQVTDFLFSERKVEFSRVVAVEYPRKGVWSLGLATGSPLDVIQKSVDQEMMTVFIPSSPTPVTGYTITVMRSEVIDLNISIDEALRYTISGGVLKPGEALPPPEI